MRLNKSHLHVSIFNYTLLSLFTTGKRKASVRGIRTAEAGKPFVPPFQ